MHFAIEKLKDGIKQLVEIHGRTSKMMIIRELFHPLTEAMNDGVKLELINNYLHEQGLEITLPTLRNMIYRIRKERGISPQKRSTQDLNAQHQNQTQTVESDKSLSTPKTEIDYQARYDDINGRFKATESFEEKYAILGGDPKKLDGHTRRKQREMCIELHMAFHNQYKPFIKI
ncbi:hypothetical protein [uncultured Aliivibrio sp.]|uniref:hypothetical protein n=1 Tax=uncultured Aliivibrio sp. TaxID=873085 RepID=UPI002612BDAA|nr:hypothetical protein [uncultured Aliivibrio sp.]